MIKEKILHGEFITGDCIDAFKDIPDDSIDMVLCDLPYGSTRNRWDQVIPFSFLWNEYWRVCKKDAIIALTSSQPFTTSLIASQINHFKYCWVWDKVNKFSGHLNAKTQPIRITEDVCIFGKSPGKYNPQMIKGKPYRAVSSGRKSTNFGTQKDKIETISDGNFFPRNLISIKGDQRGKEGRIHPTQKPIELFEYLIRTYTDEGDIVLDNAAGSGTTAVACENNKRRWICIEKEEKYASVAINRIKENESKGC